VVVVAALRRALSIAARPGGHIHREDPRIGIGQVADQQVAQPLGVDTPAGERVVGAAPAAPVGWLEAEMGHRGDGRGTQQRVGEVEQRIGAAGAAGVQLGPERTQPREGGSWHRHDRAA
jgi:hypothetical protein